nr:PIG-L family deacetylase [Symbiobacterium terraclitae]
MAPHPDDEVAGCGGAILHHRQRGDPVTVLYLTDGAASHRRPRPGLVEQRRREALAGAALLGLAAGDLIFWEQPDGRLAVTAELAAELAALLGRIRPRLIYVPFFLDDHPDHCAAGLLLAEALAGAPAEAEVWCYEVWAPLLPNRLLNITAQAAAKFAALRAHRSQNERFRLDERIERLNSMRALKVPAPLFSHLEAYAAFSADAYREAAGAIRAMLTQAEGATSGGYSVDHAVPATAVPVPDGGPRTGT